jgi:outer membrane protein OmpA-like peptidoglycan-associated protein
VFFPAGGLTLIRDARDNLDIVAAYLREHPTIALELHGHSDSVGSRATNLQLSRRRAKAVKEYLVAQGIDARRLPVRAVGESRPIASNATEEGRLKNRRVDLVPR